MYFDLSLAEWTVIEKNNPRDYASVKREVLFCWRKKKGAGATLANLVSVLASPEKFDVCLIEEIIEHFNIKRKFIRVYRSTGVHYSSVLVCSATGGG